MKYSEDEATNKKIHRYAFLSSFSARNDSEEAEAQLLHQQFGEETGWTLHGRATSMPLAPSFEFSVSLRSLGADIVLWHKESKAEKHFFLAGMKHSLPVTSHMESLTDSQCEQFIAVKVPKGKKAKVDN